MAKILIADDSMFQRKLMKDTIDEINHNWVEAKNGVEALELYKSEQPDCLILDLLMPEMDGFTVLEELQKLQAKEPKIVLSADIQETTTQRCMELGAYAFLNKPFNKDKFVKTLQEALAEKG